MHPHTPKLQAHAAAPHALLQPALLTTLALLATVWLFAWWFEVNLAVALALSLVTLVIGLMAHAIGLALAKRQNEQLLQARRTPRPAGSATGTRRFDDVNEEPLAHQFSARLNGKCWSLDVFEAIDAQRFAAVCETWFAWAGFDTRSESHRTDGGVDIWLHAAKMPGPVAIVRCKHWLDKPVGVQEMKEFVGVMSSLQSVHGTYTTTSTYTPEALQLAKEHGIDAVDGRGLLRRIQTRTRQRQQALLAVAFSGQH
ncbi:MAG: restriction endonuclease [Rhodoferax sp.]|nr:restriction endonuclease [Rhodoferax sp.]